MSNNYNHFGATHLVAGLSVISSAPSLYADLRVPTRVYDVEGGPIFSKNSTFVFFDGAAWNPRLWSPSPIVAPAWFPICQFVCHPLSTIHTSIPISYFSCNRSPNCRKRCQSEPLTHWPLNSRKLSKPKPEINESYTRIPDN